MACSLCGGFKVIDEGYTCPRCAPAAVSAPVGSRIPTTVKARIEGTDSDRTCRRISASTMKATCSYKGFPIMGVLEQKAGAWIFHVADKYRKSISL